MSNPFYDRLFTYFSTVADVLVGEAGVSEIFPNSTDIGVSREQIYADFLRHHLPTSCNVILGGFVFNLRGEESKQLDIIVTDDYCIRYDFLNKTGNTKSFSCVEGTLGAVSIKSYLNRASLEDSIINLSSIPKKRPIEKITSDPNIISDYDEWPLKVVYAHQGFSPEAFIKAIEKIQHKYPKIPLSQYPHIIQVGKKYCIFRASVGFPISFLKTDGQEFDPDTICEDDGEDMPYNSYLLSQDESGALGLLYTIQAIQSYCVASKHIDYRFNDLMSKLMSYCIKNHPQKYEKKAITILFVERAPD